MGPELAGDDRPRAAFGEVFNGGLGVVKGGGVSKIWGLGYRFYMLIECLSDERFFGVDVIWTMPLWKV